jgi:hypothetical protein
MSEPAVRSPRRGSPRDLRPARTIDHFAQSTQGVWNLKDNPSQQVVDET